MREKLKQYVDRLFVQRRQTQQTQELHDEILQNSFDRYDDAVARGLSPEEAYRTAVDGIGDLEPILREGAPAGSRWNIAVAVCLYIISVIPPIIGGELGGFGELLGPSLMFLLAAAATALLLGGGRAATPELGRRRRLRALAIALYILCVIPTILTSDSGAVLQTAGTCLMFLIAAGATMLIILSAGKRPTVPAEESAAQPDSPRNAADTASAPAQAPKKSLAWQIGTPLYWIAAALLFFAGCFFGLWRYAWLVFPLFGALSDLIVGCVRMAKGGRGGLRALTGLLWLALLVFYVFLTERTGAWLVTWLVFPIGAALRGVLSGIFELIGGGKQ